MRRRTLGAAVLAAIAGAAASFHWFRRDDVTVPPRITLEDLVANLSGSFGRDAVVQEGSATLVRQGTLEPGDPLANGERRGCLLAPPPSRIRFRVDVPPQAALRFGVGVEGPKERTAGRSAVRFSVLVDGREVYVRAVNPVAVRHDRRWFDERLDLASEADRSVEITLATEAARDDEPLAGTPGWTRVRLVRSTARDRQPARPDAPNVLVLLVDTLRADRLGCYGASPSPSPTADRLAAAGLVFERAVAQSSWTLPSVASLLSGLHPRSHGALRKEDGITADDQAVREYLADEVDTWAEQAARTGITTVGVSTNPLVSRATNLARGFETFVEMPWNPKLRNWAPAAEVNRTFLRWLERNRIHRFVGYLHYMEPHDPYTPPPALRGMPPPGVPPPVAAGWIRQIANQINWHGAPPLPAAELGYLRHLYDGEIRAWDDELAALLDGLARLGVRESTIIVLTADHGEEFQEHGRLTHGSHLYEETIRVPLIVAGPGIQPGRRSDLAQGIDLYPTLARLLGFAIPSRLPGRDLLSWREAPPAFSETADGIAPDGGPLDLVAVQVAGWKLIHTPATGRFELYDLSHDPDEHENRYGSAPESDALGRLLVDWETSAPPPPPALVHDPGLRERLRTLGYVE